MSELHKIEVLLKAMNEIAHHTLKYPDWRERIVIRREKLYGPDLSQM